MTPAEELKPRRGWAAALLTVLTPGLGHVYAGRPRRGAALLAVLWTALALWVALSLVLHVPALRIALFALVVVFWGWIVLDAVLASRATGPAYAPRRYNRALVYVGIPLLVAFVLGPAYRALVSNSIARAFAFPSGSMSPTLLAGDYLYVSARAPNPIARGHIVAWQDAEGVPFIQRVVGLPGDTIEMRRKRLRLNGEVVREAYVQHIDPESDPADSLMLWQEAHLAPEAHLPYRPSRDNWGPLVVPPGEYFLLGDNRDNSYDSRYRGLVPTEAIAGRPAWIYLSLDPDSRAIRWERIGRSIR